MKKIMIAIGAAASLALSASAAKTIFEESRIDFSSTPLGLLDVDKDDSGALTGTKYWSTDHENNNSVESVVTNDNSKYVGNYLSVQESARLYRWMKGQNVTGETIAADTTIYFSSKVEFTPSESENSNDIYTQGDKILVWLRGLEATEELSGQTNLVITAGKWNEGLGAYERYDYICDNVAVAADTAYTLLIKTTLKNNVTEFTVTLDDTDVTCGGVSTFPSMEQSSTTISKVGFIGTGAIDDLEFGKETIVAQVCNIAIQYSGESIAMAIIGAVEKKTWPATFEDVPLGTVSLRLELDGVESIIYNGTEYEADDESYVTITFDTSAVGAGGTFTVTLSDPDSGDFPWNGGTASVDIKNKYDTWKTEHGTGTSPKDEAAFLLNVAPTADTTLKVVTIGFDEDGNVVITGSKALNTVNGVVKYKAAATPGAVDAATPSEAIVDATTGKVTIPKDSAAPAEFYKIVVGY